MKRLIAIGDIHGCIHALDALLDAIRPTLGDQLVVLGDFIDGGRDTKDVVHRLISLERECELVVIEGNHEEMLLSAIENPKLRQHWLEVGGIHTLNSYAYLGGIDAIPAEHLAFIQRARPWHETDRFLFTHANYDPELGMADQPDYLLRWALLEPPYPGPHISGKTVIVGHTEQKDGEILDLGYLKCIDTYCQGYGWLTGLDVLTGEVWQASRWGAMRLPGEALEGQFQAKSILRQTPPEPSEGNTEFEPFPSA
jgi:serine/threonine protein phosphatase 1